MASDLNQTYLPSDAQVSRFERDGHFRLDGLLSPQTVLGLEPELSRIVARRARKDKPMSEQSTYELAFTQVFNLRKKSEAARELVMSKRLASAAAGLLGVRGVRLYHDQALYKQAHGGHTPWHADQYYWPMSSDRCVTAWIPLQDTPLEMGPLCLCSGSHRHDLGRDQPISDDGQNAIFEKLVGMDLPSDERPFGLGDVSFHMGWTFHRAGANRTDRPRRVMTVIYMDMGMRLSEPDSDARRFDRSIWCKGVEVGEMIAGPDNPLIYQADS